MGEVRDDMGFSCGGHLATIDELQRPGTRVYATQDGTTCEPNRKVYVLGSATTDTRDVALMYNYTGYIPHPENESSIFQLDLGRSWKWHTHEENE